MPSVKMHVEDAPTHPSSPSSPWPGFRRRTDESDGCDDPKKSIISRPSSSTASIRSSKSKSIIAREVDSHTLLPVLAGQRPTSGDRKSNDINCEWNWESFKSPRHTLVRNSNQMPMSKLLSDATRREAKFRRLARKVVNHRYFIFITTFLTVYALVGDDFRVMLTSKPADIYFNIITIMCIFVFSLEIGLSCLGKDDYILGFFFFLDCVSTATLFLDLSWFAENYEQEEVSNDDDGNAEAGSELRSGRTARIGAKAGRVVRVLRLVRILKLYKAIYEARARRQANEQDEDDWGDDGMDDDARQEQMLKGVQESRVGKKLSELTTRRVILLVLTMLLVVPVLEVDANGETPSSADYGASDVSELLMEWRMNTSFIDGEQRYQSALLKYVYYHNWFKRDAYLSHLFWAGVESQSSGLDSLSDVLRLSSTAVDAWRQKVSSPGSMYAVFGPLPDAVQKTLALPWSSQCSTSATRRLGFSLLEHYAEDPISCFDEIRSKESSRYTSRQHQLDGVSFRFVFYFDSRVFQQQTAMYGLCVTAFICVVLVVASLMFSNDANKLVLNPLEQMIKRVREIRSDPLVAMKMADEEFKMEEKHKAKAKFDSRGWNKLKNCVGLRSRPTREAMETVILEKTIIKLGSLLALGFGVAGANIIGQNLEASDSAGVNVMIPGTRVDCVVGRARIRDFSAATEVLQAKVMTFVNQIAEIVHGIVDEFHGAPNKNNGDTFLLIWRLSDVCEDMIPRMADMSVVSFAKILGAIHRSLTLADYRGHPGLQRRLGANCRVNLSFGLHAGWAIEGAVGTEFKIDASYLSPNVSIAASVESACQTYGVAILISQTVIDIVTPKVGGKCRLVDKVIIKGSPLPIQLYSFDLDYKNVPVDLPRDSEIMWNSRQRFRVRQFLESEKAKTLGPRVDMAEMLEIGEDMCAMRRPYSERFMQLFQMGYQNYSQGEWEVARRLLSDTRTMLRKGVEDGPSVALLRFMESPYQFRAPTWWQGVRELKAENISL